MGDDTEKPMLMPDGEKVIQYADEKGMVMKE